MSKSVLLSLALSVLLVVPHSQARGVRKVRLDDKTVAKILISPRGTVLSFPTKPKKVILGQQNSFGIEYVENDLAISPLKSNSRSNLFVYMHGRRFVFDLITSLKRSYSLILVTDVEDVKVRIKDE